MPGTPSSLSCRWHPKALLLVSNYFVIILYEIEEMGIGCAPSVVNTFMMRTSSIVRLSPSAAFSSSPCKCTNSFNSEIYVRNGGKGKERGEGEGRNDALPARLKNVPVSFPSTTSRSLAIGHATGLRSTIIIQTNLHDFINLHSPQRR